MKPTIKKGTPPFDAASTPVAIIGGGACGLVAALALHQHGIECIIIERDALPQGSTALSSGFIPAPCTLAQTRQSIVDSVEAFANDIQVKAKDTANKQLVAAYANAIGPAMNFLEQSHGLQWQVLDTFLYPGHSQYRMHTLVEKTGDGLMQHLTKAVETAGITLLCNAQVTALWCDNEKIGGISFTRPDGREEDLKCDVVLLACNGFGGNRELVSQYLPEISNAQYGGHNGNDGSAILWAQELGISLQDMNAYQGHGSWATPHGALISWALMMEGGIQVNCNGQRFHDENQGYSEAAVHVLAQPGSVAWNVFDETLYELGKTFPDFCAAEKAGAIKRFSSISELSNAIGCDSAELEKSCVQPKFKRNLAAPFYAVKITGALFHTQGGIKIDKHCHVVKSYGSIIPNLLAAGGAAGGVSGNAVWGYLSGNGLLSAVAGGYIAAQTIAAQTAQKYLEKN
jgi:fumarate reductase flavoprotein subunit